jgi:hypothetical protein
MSAFIVEEVPEPATVAPLALNPAGLAAGRCRTRI